MGGMKTSRGKKDPSVGMIECLEEFTATHNLVVGRTMVNMVDVNWTVPVLVVNLNSHVVTLPARTRMASITQVTLIQDIKLNSAAQVSEVTDVPQHILSMVPEEELTSEQRDRATVLLGNYVAQFPAPGKPITGSTDAVLHDIDTGDTKLVRTSLRRLSLIKIQEQNMKVAEMLKGGQIKSSDSPCLSPTMLEKKKDGTLRFCVDYRQLSYVTNKDAFPLPPY